MLKVIQVAALLSVSDVTIYKKMKKLRNELKGKIVKQNGIKLLTEEAVEIIKNDLCTKNTDAQNPRIDKGKEDPNEPRNNFGEELVRKLEESLGHQIQKLEQQIDLIHSELKEKNKMLNTNAETINQLIETHAQERERTDTIIMKLTQDLEQVRHENRLFLEESEKKEELPKYEPKKTDRVISIQEYIAAKIDEDIERSNYEAEKRRLKEMYEDPLRGKSALYKIYIKMFHPEKLRKNIY